MKRRQKILMVLPLPPPVHGASLRNQSIIKSKAIQDSFRVSLIPMHFIKENSEMGKFSIYKIFLALRLYANLTLRIITFRPKLIYFNMATYGLALYRDFLVVFITKILNKRLIIHLRTQGIESQIKISKIKKYLFSKAFANTTLVCLSEALAQDVTNVYEGSPVIINNGIEDFGVDKRSYNPEKVVFLFLSNFLKTKGIFELIDASEKLCELFPKRFEVVIAGKEADISHEEIREYLRQTNTTSYISTIGPIYGDEKNALFLNSDIFVFPTTFEAFPGVILEAMQFGLPVISTNEGAIPEIVTNNVSGIIIEKNNPMALVNAMSFYIKNPKKIIEFGKHGRAVFRNKYTLQHFEKSMAGLFNET